MCVAQRDSRVDEGEVPQDLEIGKTVDQSIQCAAGFELDAKILGTFHILIGDISFLLFDSQGNSAGRETTYSL